MRYLVGQVRDVYDGTRSVLDVGSMVVSETHKSYRHIVEAMPSMRDTGLDASPGHSVDVVCDDPYIFPIESESINLVISRRLSSTSSSPG